ncbi:MAG: sugar phosphate isomerase/epimerase family protein [Ignisphaera sp.]|uniref:Sugar phosphate isomerase/epimerase n=1 Tax=Ignisphaera aggregans TaxID=334771 RepID=A0A7C4NLV9_9CREN
MPVYAYSTMMYLKLPPLKAVERLTELGLHVELSYDNFAIFGGRALEDKFMTEILNVSHNLHGYVEVIHTPYDEMEPQKLLTDSGFRRFTKWFNLANKLGVRVAVVHTLKVEEGYGNAFELNIEFLSMLIKEAKDKGVKLAVENRPEKKLFGSKPKDLIRIVEHLGEDVGVCLDLGHAHINRNLQEFFSIGKGVVVIHAHDNDGYRDLHKPPYSGTIKWSLVEAWVTRIKYSNLIVFEVLCKDSVQICDSIVEQVRSTPIANI